MQGTCSAIRPYQPPLRRGWTVKVKVKVHRIDPTRGTIHTISKWQEELSKLIYELNITSHYLCQEEVNRVDTVSVQAKLLSMSRKEVPNRVNCDEGCSHRIEDMALLFGHDEPAS